MINASIINLSDTVHIIKSIIDVVIVWILVYYIISLFKSNLRTMQLFKGIVVIALVKIITSIFELTTLDGIVNSILNWGILGVIVIFQPEIRTLLEKIGQTSMDFEDNLTADERDAILNELVSALQRMSNDHTGALITFERHTSMQDFINTGVKFEGEIKSELITTIFYEGTPLHDGATIIKNDMIVASACFYPPTNKEVPAEYGARHRAAIGISEITDSLTIVVSEETGNISFATNGELRVIPLKELRASLVKELDWYHNSDEGDKDA